MVEASRFEYGFRHYSLQIICKRKQIIYHSVTENYIFHITCIRLISYIWWAWVDAVADDEHNLLLGVWCFRLLVGFENRTEKPGWFEPSLRVK